MPVEALVHPGISQQVPMLPRSSPAAVFFPAARNVFAAGMIFAGTRFCLRKKRLKKMLNVLYLSGIGIARVAEWQTQQT